jgi:hypothetical protein
MPAPFHHFGKKPRFNARGDAVAWAKRDCLCRNCAQVSGSWSLTHLAGGGVTCMVERFDVSTSTARYGQKQPFIAEAESAQERTLEG